MYDLVGIHVGEKGERTLSTEQFYSFALAHLRARARVCALEGIDVSYDDRAMFRGIW